MILGELKKDRLETLIDGVFAIAMTILVLNLSIPGTLNITSSGELLSAYYGMIKVLKNYIISFVVLGSIWLAQAYLFKYISKVDKKTILSSLSLLL